MLNNEQWQAREQEVAELQTRLNEFDKQLKELERIREELYKQRKETAKKIHVIQIALNQHSKHKEHKTQTNTEVYKMFGKPLKELTKEEYKIYYNARQKINRQKRKEKQTKNLLTSL